ncbi:hypothetical protein KSF78_0001273 [Schistosoma japonicum]|nr:hypothetical protein KSF78_0001273 [Schistosoma japonicum]
MKCKKTKCKKKTLKPLSWEEQLGGQIQFVNVYDNTDGICYSADESTDVMIMKTDAPFALKDSSVRLRKPSVSKCFEAEPMIDLDRLCVSGEDLLFHSSIPEHRQATK